DLLLPYRVRSDEDSRRFAREFWSTDRGPELSVCAKSDLGMVFQPKLWKTGMSAVYLFHRGMHAQARPRPKILDPNWASKDGRMVRLVFFDELPRENPVFDQWLARIQDAYRVRSIDQFVVSPGKPGERWLREQYVVLSLIPVELATSRRARLINHSEVER